MKKFTILFAALLCAVCICGAMQGCTVGSGKGDGIEILCEGWLNQSLPQDTDKNPYNAYLKEKFGVDFTFTTTSDMNTQIAKRFTSSKTAPPDIIVFQEAEDFTAMMSLYGEGFLVEDYTPYMEHAPKVAELFADETSQISRKFKQNGNIIALTLPKDGETWAYKIRQDWVDRFCDGVAPKTPEELLALAEKVKSIATDGNGDPVYYLFTSSGKMEDFGRSLKELINVWGYSDWYVNSQGQVSHPILDGNHKTYLDFVKMLVKNKYIQPNWYTDTWENHKSLIYVNNSAANTQYNGRIGMAMYNASIVTESVYYNDNENDCEVFSHLDMPKASSSGQWATTTPEFAGKAEPLASFNRIIVVSANAAKNAEKMKKIMQFVNSLAYPDDTYYAMRWGVGCDNYEYGDEILPVNDESGKPTGYQVYLSQKNKETHAKHKYGFIDYGSMCATTLDKFIEYGTSLSVTTSPYKYIELDQAALAFNTANSKVNYAELLQLNNIVYTNCMDYQREFEINYVLGVPGYSDYNAFVNQWRSIGGDTLKNQATAQLRVAGYVN